MSEECEHNRPFWECEICGNRKAESKPPSHDDYRGKSAEERRKNYESRLTKDGVPIHKILEKLEKPPNIGIAYDENYLKGYITPEQDKDYKWPITVEKEDLERWLKLLAEIHPQIGLNQKSLIRVEIEGYLGEKL